MKQKLTTLPKFIVRLNRYFYLNTKDQSRIHISKLSSFCPAEQIDPELKHELLLSQRWDLNKD